MPTHFNANTLQHTSAVRDQTKSLHVAEICFGQSGYTSLPSQPIAANVSDASATCRKFIFANQPNHAGLPVGLQKISIILFDNL